MEEDKRIHIVCVGHVGAGRTTLTEALKRELEVIDKNNDELDEFDRAGLHLTDEQKQKLRDMGITADKLISIMYKDPFEELEKKMDEVIKSMEIQSYEPHVPLSQSKPWEKKHFWE